MLANSPDTTALFFNTSFEPELSQPEPASLLAGLNALTDDADEFLKAWAREWVKAPISIDRISDKALGLICILYQLTIVSHKCTRQTLRTFNGKIISTLLYDKNYNLDHISQLLELVTVELDDGGREYVGLIDYLVQKLMADEQDISLTLKCLSNLSKNVDLKNMIKRHSKINKLYKKLTNMLKHEDDNIVRYALYLLISFLSDTSLGKKLFNESSIKEAFTLLFSSPSLHETLANMDPIFKDLLGLMLDKKEYSEIFERLVKDNWDNDFSWCSSVSLDVIIAVKELLKRDLVTDIVLKCIEKFDLYDVAMSYLTKHYSDDALELINILLKHSSGDEWGKKCLHLIFSVTEQYRNGDPFMDLFLNLNPDILPQNNGFDLHLVARQFYAKQIKETGPFPSCFRSFWEQYGSLLTEEAPDTTIIYRKLSSYSKEEVLKALIELQNLDITFLESLADHISKVGNMPQNDALLEQKIEKLDKQVMDAVEESKKLLIVKEELMNAKMDILKGKIHFAEKEKKDLQERYDSEVKALNEKNKTVSHQLNFLTAKFEEITKLGAAKDKTIETLNHANEQKAQEINLLKNKIMELEESIGEQEEEHQEMVAKLAQSLDSLANRKTRITKKKANLEAQEDVESLGKDLQSTRI